MFLLRNKKKLPLNYPQYARLSGALISSVTGLLHNRIMTPNIQEYLSLILFISGIWQWLIYYTLGSKCHPPPPSLS